MDPTLKIIIGYVVFTLYTVGIMAAGMLVEKKTNLDKTVCRKLTHIISAFIWVICWYFFGCSIHWVILNGLGAVALYFMTFGHLIKTYERDDTDKSYGLFYFGLATFIVATVCYIVGEELYLYTGITYYCLALGDGFAPVVVRLFKKNVKITETRSLIGSLTVFIVSFLSTLVFSTVFGMNLPILFILSVAALTCIVEFYGLKGLDNLFIEFFVFGYLVLYHYGLITVSLQIVVLLLPPIAMTAVGRKSLAISGGITSLLMFLAVGFFAPDFVAPAFMLIAFVLEAATSLIVRKIQKEGDHAPANRNGYQVAAVALVATISIIIYKLTGLSVFYYAYFLTLVGQFADSIASDVGKATKGKTIDVLRLKEVEKGISGGVSLLGTAAALVSSAALAAIGLAFGAYNFTVFVIIALFAFFGTMIDSMLGSACQALYTCPSCGKVTEEKTCCGEKTKLIKGFSFIDNVTVNMITSVLTFGLGMFLFLL